MRACVLLFAAITALAPAGVGWRDIDGREFNPLQPAGAAGVMVFVSSDCPVSNGYAPEIQRICHDYSARGVSCALVYEDMRIEAAAVRKHLDDYRYRGIRAAIDGDRALAQKVQATVTPEAVVVDKSGATRYRGRVDNKYVSLGTARQVVTSHDLRDAIEAVLAGRPVPHPKTEAVGCFIPPAKIGK